MLKKKYRNIVFNEEETKKAKGAATYFEAYDIADKIRLIIQSVHTEKSNYLIHGTYNYKIDNCSHFQIDAEIDFTNSQNILTQEKTGLQPNQSLFKTHFEPYAGLSKDPSLKDEGAICEIQYLKGYNVQGKIKCALTFPSLQIQQNLINEEDEEIRALISKSKSTPHSLAELFIFFIKDVKKLKTFMYQNAITDTKGRFFFIDGSFPPLQVKSRLLDLSKEIVTKQSLMATETDKDKQREILFHYRGIEDVIPNKASLINVDEINPYDITFGLFQNQNVLSIFTNLAEYPQLLLRLFPQTEISPFGLYKVKLFTMGAWTLHYVDKYIPCFPLSFPLYTYSPHSLWVSLLEKALAKYFGGYDSLAQVPFHSFYTILTGFPVLNFNISQPSYVVNSNLSTDTSVPETMSTIIEIIHSKRHYILSCYASQELIDKRDKQFTQFFLKNTVYPLLYANTDFVVIKNIFKDFSLPQSFSYSPSTEERNSVDNFLCSSESNLCYIQWDKLSSLFDNVIVIQSDLYHEAHFRGGFIRCQDVDSPDYDRILSHSYYVVKIHRDNINMKLAVNLNDKKTLENNYLLPEIDLKFGMLKVKDNKYGYIDTPDFSIGYTHVFEKTLKKGEYIIVPMTMGYAMQVNPNVKFNYYSLKDEKGNPLPMTGSLISAFCDDLFYINDPLSNGFLPFKVVREIASNIVDNKGRRILPLEEDAFFSMCNITPELKDKRRDEKGMTLNLFKDFIYQQLVALDEEHKVQSLQNMGYDNNAFPYLGRFFTLSFYFKGVDSTCDDISVMPMNNLIDSNIDTFVNMLLLKKKNSIRESEAADRPIRVYYENGMKWYTVEGVTMEKVEDGRKLLMTERIYTFQPQEERYFSTFKPDVKTVVNADKIKFVMYTVKKGIEIVSKDKDNSETEN